jgi:hypothetical protein
MNSKCPKENRIDVAVGSNDSSPTKTLSHASVRRLLGRRVGEAGTPSELALSR